MKRFFFLFLITAALLFLCGCSDIDTDLTGFPSGSEVSPSADVSPSGDPAASPSSGPITESDAWRGIYTDFLQSNYTELSEALSIGIAGVGFIDLDVDGMAELLIFDSGASASMGVQIFDYVSGRVTCISANILTAGEAFGGEHFTTSYVNANYFDSFRLLKDINGNLLFCVESSNGAIDFIYSELICFGADGNALTLKPLLYKWLEYDDETGDVKTSAFRIHDEDVSEGEYQAAYDDFFLTFEDTGYEAAGAFVWENATYADGYDGFMEMVAAAMAAYVSIDYPNTEEAE